MADKNVFGEPITEDGLMTIPEYANKARKDRSIVAMQWQNKDGKYHEAVKYVWGLKEKWGIGVSTLCLVYNATGEPLTFVKDHDWFGHIYQTYPQVIENGQWGGFFHVKNAVVPSGSEAAVVYRGKNKDGEATDWMLAWSNPWDKSRYDNQAYAEIHEAGHFAKIDWQIIANRLERVHTQHRAEWNGCTADVKTQSGTTAIYEAVLSLRWLARM